GPTSWCAGIGLAACSPGGHVQPPPRQSHTFWGSTNCLLVPSVSRPCPSTNTSTSRCAVLSICTFSSAYRSVTTWTVPLTGTTESTTMGNETAYGCCCCHPFGHSGREKAPGPQ